MTDQEIANFIREDNEYMKSRSDNLSATDWVIALILLPVWTMGYVLFWAGILTICFGTWYVIGWLLWIVAMLLGIL